MRAVQAVASWESGSAFVVEHLSPARIKLSWPAALAGDSAVWYRVYRDGVQIHTTEAPALFVQDDTVDPATSYVYSVSALDAMGAETPSADRLSIPLTTPSRAGVRCRGIPTTAPGRVG
jgi:hypothetical protein